MTQIETIKNLKIEQKYHLNKDELLSIYKELGRPNARVVKKKDVLYVAFETYTNAQFILKNIKSIHEIDFIESKLIVDLDNPNKNFIEFLFLEVTQGDNILQKFLRILEIFSLIYLFNVLILFFASEKNIATICISLLSAVSVFIAIFSVFIANQNYFEKAEKHLFESGKIVYYFSVDRNLTLCGLLAIFASLLSIIITKDSSDSFVSAPWKYIYQHDYFSRKGLLILFTNISFIFTYITLRSLVEFYVKRPAKYRIGLLKDKFLHNKE